jgi:hypothetical protein
MAKLLTASLNKHSPKSIDLLHGTVIIEKLSVAQVVITEDYILIGSEAVYSGEKYSEHFREPAASIFRVEYVKVAVAGSFEIMTSFCQNTWRYILDDALNVEEVLRNVARIRHVLEDINYGKHVY